MNARPGGAANGYRSSLKGASDRRMASAPRQLAALHLLYGAGLLAAANTHLQRPGDAASQETAWQARLFARVLGVRNLAQALLLAQWPTRNWILASTATDGLHAASMILLAWANPSWRRPALGSATATAILCACGVRCSLRRQ